MLSTNKINFAAKALVISDDKFLAVRKKSIASDKFELPGGKMEFGETAEETVVREVLEETGLKIRPVKLLDTWNYVAETFQVTGIIYLCVTDDNHIVLSDEHECYEWLAAKPESFEKMNRLFRFQMFKWNWNELFNLVKAE